VVPQGLFWAFMTWQGQQKAVCKSRTGSTDYSYIEHLLVSVSKLSAIKSAIRYMHLNNGLCINGTWFESHTLILKWSINRVLTLELSKHWRPFECVQVMILKCVQCMAVVTHQLHINKSLFEYTTLFIDMYILKLVNRKSLM